DSIIQSVGLKQARPLEKASGQ
ncbi:MAG: hypothetical protein K0Q92_3048, partial [Steroidobacteraceae bacterium]|nr:hypothetical protein [Steroidobacteraceae bacterium]